VVTWAAGYKMGGGLTVINKYISCGSHWQP
jgi:hypothetical protein